MWHLQLSIFVALLRSGFAYGDVDSTKVYQECAADNAGRGETAVEEQRVQEVSSLLQSRVELEQNSHLSEKSHHTSASDSAATRHEEDEPEEEEEDDEAEGEAEDEAEDEDEDEDEDADVSVGSAKFYETFLAAHMEPDPVDLEREGRLRADMAANPLSVHLVEQHDQSMHWWIRQLHSALESQAPAVLQASAAHRPSATSRRLVVHVDTHSDIGAEIWKDWTHDGKGRFTGGRAGAAMLMAKNVDIANFIAASVVAGMVTDVVWVRSCFPQSLYNGPGPGHFLVGFFVAENKASVCQQIIANGAPSRQVERDRELRIFADFFNTCTGNTSQLGRATAIATMNLTVTSLEYLEQDVDNMFSEGSDTFHEWMLDVDQDFFAAIGFPGWKFIEHFLKPLSSKQILQVQSILIQLGSHCDLEVGAPSMNLVMEHMGKHTADEILDSFESGKSDCSLPDSLGEELASLAMTFSKKQWKIWKKAWYALRDDDLIHEMDTVFLPKNQEQRLPDYRPDQEELRSTLDIFEGKVRSLYRRLGTPTVVTLCRSLLNGYLPKDLWPQIESGALKALRAGLERPDLALDKDAQNPSEELYQHLG